MLTFKNYFAESKKLPEPSPTVQKSVEEISKALGKSKINALLNHPWMKNFASYQKAYKHGVDRANFHEVEVYPYFEDVHKTESGAIRPTTMLRFHFSDSSRISNVHKFTRDITPKPNQKDDWKHVTSWRDVE